MSGGSFDTTRTACGHVVQQSPYLQDLSSAQSNASQYNNAIQNGQQALNAQQAWIAYNGTYAASNYQPHWRAKAARGAQEADDQENYVRAVASVYARRKHHCTVNVRWAGSRDLCVLTVNRRDGSDVDRDVPFDAERDAIHQLIDSAALSIATVAA